jgi:hypothetical protein
MNEEIKQTFIDVEQITAFNNLGNPMVLFRFGRLNHILSGIKNIQINPFSKR